MLTEGFAPRLANTDGQYDAALVFIESGEYAESTYTGRTALV